MGGLLDALTLELFATSSSWMFSLLENLASDLQAQNCVKRKKSFKKVGRPLFWNIAFDDILKEEVPPRVSIICNADNTLVVTTEVDIPILEQK